MHVIPYGSGQNLRTSQLERTTETAFSNKVTLLDTSTKHESQDVTTSTSVFANVTELLDEEDMNTQNNARNYPFNTNTTDVSLQINRQTSVSSQVADEGKLFSPEESFDTIPTAKSLLPNAIRTPVITLGTKGISEHFDREVTKATIRSVSKVIPDNSIVALTTSDSSRQTASEVTADTLTNTENPTETTSAGSVVTIETTYFSAETDKKETPATFTTTTEKLARNNEGYSVTLATTKDSSKDSNEDTETTLPITNTPKRNTLDSVATLATTTTDSSKDSDEDTETTLPITKTPKRNTLDSVATLANEHASGQIATDFERILKSDPLLKIPSKSVRFGGSKLAISNMEEEISNTGSLQGAASDITVGELAIYIKYLT
ncbi:uncharacterized protein PB18E9.04c-like [Limulus polyphemus]|uniref:Uncharacterized protein PB18E9.04c-like n=1 Tax=Limulus polyphemus TaxID=6850 RepID=A0ABM1BNR1_LIMPO|nr:uncharacterized protein PB18E9.04c-like [Limulus polyphemus]